MKVHWTDTARDHLRAIHAYVARNSPEYALRVVDRLTRRSQQIAEFPLSGREVAEFGSPKSGRLWKAPFESSITSSLIRSTCLLSSTAHSKFPSSERVA